MDATSEQSSLQNCRAGCPNFSQRETAVERSSVFRREQETVKQHFHSYSGMSNRSELCWIYFNNLWRRGKLVILKFQHLCKEQISIWSRRLTLPFVAECSRWQLKVLFMENPWSPCHPNSHVSGAGWILKRNVVLPRHAQPLILTIVW